MRVAVVIPCRNVEPHVERAVRSALEQQGVDVEVLAVDDGSTDGTLDALKRLEGDARGRLRVLSGAHAGACAARNAGLRGTAAPIVRFLDADDALLPDALRRQCALMQQANADVVAGAYVKRHPDGRPDEMEQPWTGDPWEGLVRTRLGTTSADLFRRDAVMAAGGWDETMRSSQDYELLFRLLKQDARVAVDEAPSAVVLKRTSGSISRTDEGANWMRYLELRRAIREHLRALGGEGHRALIDLSDQYLFMAIRVLSAHDRSAAFQAFDRLLPAGFVPEAGPATSPAYARAFRWLGFRWAERLAALKDAITGR
jgi:glycosyltransferase involved in cell wall biosynthesis